jgi:HEAT repeat protein
MHTTLNPHLRLIAMRHLRTHLPRVAFAGLAALALLVFSPSSLLAQDDNPFGAPEDTAPAAGDAAPPAETPPAETPPATDDPFGAGGDAPADEPAMEAEPAADAPAGGDDPFGSADEPAADAAADAKPAAKPVAAGDAPPADAAPAIPDDPAVLAVLESKPQTPFDLLRATQILTDLGHPRLALPFVKQLTGQKLDAEQQAALFKKFPSATLMRLARNAELAKEIGPFLDGLYQSADAMRRNPARLAEWIKHLSDPSEAVRAQATQALLLAGDSAVAPLVAVMADPAREKEHRLAKRVLVQLGNEGVPALLGTLESPNDLIKTQVVEVLGAIQAEKAVAALMAPLVSPQSSLALRAMTGAAIQRISGRVPNNVEAMQLLEHAARRRLAESQLVNPSDIVEFWQWDAAKNESVPVNYDARGAKLAEALRLAADLRTLDGEDPGRRRLYLITLLQAAKLGVGLDKPLPTEAGTPYAVAASFGPHAIEDALGGAMAEGYIPAAIAAAQILGDIGQAEMLAHAGAAPSILARAASHSDRRLRFAATEAIMKLDPKTPFAGSSGVTQSLGYFAGSYGVPRILIAHPLSAEGGKLAGLAAALGYEADVAVTGRQAFELATSSPDYELAFIHAVINRPAADELLAQLRRDRRTRYLPVGFISPLNDLERVQSFARRSGDVQAFLQPQNDAEMKIFVGDVLARAGQSHVPVEQRRLQALAAIGWLVKLAQQHTGVFDVAQLEAQIIPLLYVPEMSGRAIELLADIGNQRSQQALVQLANTSVQPLATRQAAVTALAQNIRKYGTLLTSGEIYAQYDLYNLNAGRNRDTHVVLSALLDVIEHQGDPPPAVTNTSGP